MSTSQNGFNILQHIIDKKNGLIRCCSLSYIFVNTQQHELYQIKRLPKVATYLHVAGRPSTVPNTVIEVIKKMIGIENLTVSSDFCESEKVKIVDGPLTGYKGILVQQKGKRDLELK